MDFIIGAIIGYLARDESIKNGESAGRFFLRCLWYLVVFMVCAVIFLFVLVNVLDFLVGLAPSTNEGTP
jgi:uncharacterized membrane protein